MLPIKKISTLSFIKLCGAGLSVIFYLLQVDFFGVSRTIECYFVALSLVAIILSITQVGHLSPHFLPIYHERREKYGDSAANQSFWVVVNWLLALAVIVLFFSQIFSLSLVSLIAPGYDEASKSLIVRIFRILSFSIILQVLSLKLNLLLNALNVFNRSELLSLIKIGISLITLLFGYQKLGIWSLILGIYLGHLVALILYFRLLSKHGIYYQFIFSTTFFNHKYFFKNLIYIYPFIFSKRLFDIVITASVSFLPQGVYAIYKYIESIFARTGGIVLSPTTNIFFTNYSIASSTKPKDGQKLLYNAFKINWIVSLFVLLVVLSFGNDIIDFFWYNRIDENQHSLAYIILLTSFISLLFTTIGGLCFKMIFVMSKTRTLYIGRAIINLLLALYAFFSIKFFQETGLISIVIVSSLLSNSLFLFLAYKNDKSILNSFSLHFLAKTIFLFILYLLVGYAINHLNIPIDSYDRSSIFFILVIKTTLMTVCAGAIFFLFRRVF